MHNFKSQADDARLDITPQRYIEETGVIGLYSKSGRYGGTFAHQHIALNFCYWISPEFQVYFIEEFERLKNEEAERQGLTWNLRREISKANYTIHTDATLIKMGFTQKERLAILARRAKRELEILSENKALGEIKKLESGNK